MLPCLTLVAAANHGAFRPAGRTSSIDSRGGAGRYSEMVNTSADIIDLAPGIGAVRASKQYVIRRGVDDRAVIGIHRRVVHVAARKAVDDLSPCRSAVTALEDSSRIASRVDRAGIKRVYDERWSTDGAESRSHVAPIRASIGALQQAQSEAAGINVGRIHSINGNSYDPGTRRKDRVPGSSRIGAFIEPFGSAGIDCGGI